MDSDIESSRWSSDDFSNNEDDRQSQTGMACGSDIDDTVSEGPEIGGNDTSDQGQPPARQHQWAGWVREGEKVPSNNPELPWYPFQSAMDFRLANWFIETQTSKTKINNYFNSGLSGSLQPSFRSSHMLRKIVDSMDESLGKDSWTTGRVELATGPTRFLYRNPVEVIGYLFRQQAFARHMVYAPQKVYNSEGERVISDMHTADWWWETQVGHPSML